MWIKQADHRTIIENLIIILLFVGGANFFVFLKITGIEDPSTALDPRFPEEPLMIYFRVTTGGAIIGSLILLYENYLHPRVTKKLTLFFKRLVWQLDVALLIIVPIFMVFSLFQMYENDISFRIAAKSALAFLSTGLFISFFVYYYFLSILVSFFRRLHKSFGQHVFFNYLIGKYAEPLEEKRTFLFFDLNDSTRIAEKLGHVRYSRFLNLCFDDILDALKPYDYDIYQFVGDEVVFTWPITKNDKGKAIEMFHVIQNQLKQKEENYIKIFGLSPVFKGAISTGKVTATLVGGKAKNIAYHGDVMNTTARLLGLCKKYNRDVLFTQFYLKSLDQEPFFESELIATLKLRGKANESKVYALKPI